MRLFFSLSLFLLGLNYTFQVKAQATENHNVLISLIKEAYVPGISLAYFEDGKIKKVDSYGYKSMDTKVEIDSETVFSAASLSKCVLAYIVMQMVEQGIIHLDLPMIDYYNYDDIAHDKRSKKVTPRMVLSHTTGLPNWRNGKLNFKNDPGEKFGYSGEGFVWLQKTIEHITGKGLETLAQERVFGPLKMERTSYIFLDSFSDNHAIPHDQRMITNAKSKITEANAAHSLQTTAHDYAKFLIAIISYQRLSEKSIKLMLTPQIMVEEFQERNEKIQWGLGVGLQHTSSGDEFWHWGDNGTFKAYFTVSTSKKKGLVYFANGSNGLGLTKEITDLYMNTSQPSVTYNDYTHFKDPRFKFYLNAYEQGIEEAMKPFLNNQGKVDTSIINHRSADWTAQGWIRERRFDLAGPMLKKLQEAFPESSRSYTSLGKYSLLTGNRGEAIKHYGKARTLSPEDKDVINILNQLKAPPSSGIEFSLSGFNGAKMVSIVGPFNNWNELANICTWHNGAWRCFITLEPGEYEYKFKVDGINILDPNNSESTYNGSYYTSITQVK